MVKTSVIIPTYNRATLLCDTLRNLAESLPDDGEIIVVDQSDAVSGELMEIVKNHCGRIHYYKIFVKGLPHARNYGLERAIGDVVIFCDDDVIPSRDFIKNHVRNYEEKEVGGVGGRIITPGRRETVPHQTYLQGDAAAASGVFPTEAQSLPLHKQYVSGKFQPIGRIRWWDGHLTDNFDATTRTYIDHAQGCNMSFRKDAVFQAGGFDERFGGSAHLEETDLCLRICRAGYKIVFDPEAELVHLKDAKGGCRAENYRQWFYWYGHNGMLFFLKNFNRWLFPVFAVSSLVRLTLSACKRLHPMIIAWGIRGYWVGLRAYQVIQ